MEAKLNIIITNNHHYQQVEANPETNGLRRLLAVKKSLAEFEQNVELVSKEIFHFSIIGGSSCAEPFT